MFKTGFIKLLNFITKMKRYLIEGEIEANPYLIFVVCISKLEKNLQVQFIT